MYANKNILQNKIICYNDKRVYHTWVITTKFDIFRTRNEIETYQNKKIKKNKICKIKTITKNRDRNMIFEV